MLGINPYIAFRGNCRDAIAFYQEALGAKVTFMQTYGESPISHMGPPDKIVHCSMQLGGSTIMASDDLRPEAAAPGGNISLAIGLDDLELARQIFTNLSAGGTILMPLQKTFWAEAFGMVTDKFGVTWMVNCEAPH